MHVNRIDSSFVDGVIIRNRSFNKLKRGLRTQDVFIKRTMWTDWWWRR